MIHKGSSSGNSKVAKEGRETGVQNECFGKTAGRALCQGWGGGPEAQGAPQGLQRLPRELPLSWSLKGRGVPGSCRGDTDMGNSGEH